VIDKNERAINVVYTVKFRYKDRSAIKTALLFKTTVFGFHYKDRFAITTTFLVPRVVL